MIRRPPRSTLFPTRRSSDLLTRPAPPTQPKQARTPPTRPSQAPFDTPAADVFLLARAFLRDREAVPLRVLRSEEHTSELQSRQYLVCRLLLEKKNPST